MARDDPGKEREVSPAETDLRAALGTHAPAPRGADDRRGTEGAGALTGCCPWPAPPPRPARNEPAPPGEKQVAAPHAAGRLPAWWLELPTPNLSKSTAKMARPAPIPAREAPGRARGLLAAALAAVRGAQRRPSAWRYK